MRNARSIFYLGTRRKLMIPKRMDYVQRQSGFFLYKGRMVPAVHAGDGVGVVVVFEPSRLDWDFGSVVYPRKAELFWFPSAPDLHRILAMLDESDRRTFDLVGKGWGGVRAYDELQSFV